jgi:hypothetical protein
VVDDALKKGRGGLPAGSSLAWLRARERGVPHSRGLSRLTEDQILRWADAFHESTGRWPTRRSGPIKDAPGETWNGVDSALIQGGRGLPGGSSLSRLVPIQGTTRKRSHPPRLTVQQILAWADAFHARTGKWPNVASGPIAKAPGESWRIVHEALYGGYRGLPGGSSLAKLLHQERRVRSPGHLPPLSIPQVLQWAQAHHDRHRRWPTPSSGSIPEAPAEMWVKIDRALRDGLRGLPGGGSLARLLKG